MAQKKTTQDTLFVKVPDSKNLRVGILESSRSLLESLKRYENYKKTRNDKRQLIEKARADLKEVARLVTQVRTMMPQVTIKEQPKPIPKPVIRPMLPPPKPVTVQPRKKTEIELLESELAEIEKKIKSIA